METGKQVTTRDKHTSNFWVRMETVINARTFRFENEKMQDISEGDYKRFH